MKAVGSLLGTLNVVSEVIFFPKDWNILKNLKINYLYDLINYELIRGGIYAIQYKNL